MYFSNILKTISECFNEMDLRNEKSLLKLKNAFSVDLDCETIRYVVALTQYMLGADPT